MNYPLLAFGIVSVVGLGFLGWFLRGALFSISGLAAQHAKIYAIAYVKGGALILIAAFASFEQAYWALDEAFRNSMGWAPYVIFFSKPVTGALAVLVAFLDRSTQRATEEGQAAGLLPKPATTPPFASPTPP